MRYATRSREGAPTRAASRRSRQRRRDGNEATKLPLTIRLIDIDRRVDLERIQQAGIRVTVRPATGAKLIRFRIFKVRTAQAAKARAVTKTFRVTR